jgi:hypothetical protein
MKSSTHESIKNENVHDIFMRNATLTLLDLLNRNVIIDLKRNDKVEKHEIPFFYNFGGDEGFMKDFFLELPTDCKYPNHAEGNYEQMPRGVVTLSSFAIKSSNKTFKIIEKIFDFYYKNQVKYFQFRGVRVPAQITFPDTADFQKAYSFTYTDANIVSITLNLDMETYFPSFDDHSTIYKGNTIHQFNLRESQEGSNATLNDSWIDQDYPPAE